MKRYAVSHIDWFSHELTTEIISAENEAEAASKHSKVQDYDWEGAETLEAMKRIAFDCDSMIHALEIS